MEIYRMPSYKDWCLDKICASLEDMCSLLYVEYMNEAQFMMRLHRLHKHIRNDVINIREGISNVNG